MCQKITRRSRYLIDDVIARAPRRLTDRIIGPDPATKSCAPTGGTTGGQLHRARCCRIRDWQCHGVISERERVGCDV
ncbi:MAG: hypothetical protein V7643_4289 [Mycobacterium sp.]|jgi:hypothetical protein